MFTYEMIILITPFKYPLNVHIRKVHKGTYVFNVHISVHSNKTKSDKVRLGLKMQEGRTK